MKYFEDDYFWKMPAVNEYNENTMVKPFNHSQRIHPQFFRQNNSSNMLLFDVIN